MVGPKIYPGPTEHSERHSSLLNPRTSFHPELSILDKNNITL